ncbi:MAG TPA: nitronate monooxygenase [Longimicrobiaceae bacterium]|jgi:NAD(P)H-dependent flavin oxidoreductase YrpB (nitropropane dioxygenase family)|nr:nitronate monooxygenase [Longimicrobiaceae bacterium]
MTAALPHPLIIQGGMGVGVSNWVLAKAVSMRGQMGVVSGTCVDSLLVRRLQDGDIGGHVRRAMAAFPIPEVSAEVLKRYFNPDGRAEGEPYKAVPMYRQVVSKVREQLTVLSSFVEVYLAKEGHDGVVGINLLTKVQMPNLMTLYGAMLAKVDYVLMGAGIPKDIPGALDRFVAHEPASIKLDVDGLDRGEAVEMTFDPRTHALHPPVEMKRPYFLPIIASNSLATMLAKKANGRVDGFIIEAPTAGGHNAPPRGELVVNERGEPQYGERDEVDLEKMKDHGLPFWLAGGAGSPERLEQALEAGAAGIQVGTLFAYCEESGIGPDLKREVIQQAQDDRIDVLTDGRASPTGFPFKVVQLGGTVSELPVYQKRERICDLGYLRTAFKDAKGRVGFRCPAEPVDQYVKKGGDAADTVGRKCLCNALFATIGQPQVRDGGELEAPLITSGDELKHIRRFIGSDRMGYTAGEVIDYLMTGLKRLMPSMSPATEAAGAR